MGRRKKRKPGEHEIIISTYDGAELIVPFKEFRNPPKELQEDLIYRLASINCTYDEIGAVCNVHPDTIRNRFSDTVKKGREEGKSSLKRKMWKLAMEGNNGEGNVGMLIWLSKQMLGYTDKPVETLTDEEKAFLDRYRELKKKADAELEKQARSDGDANHEGAKPAALPSS